MWKNEFKKQRLSPPWSPSVRGCFPELNLVKPKLCLIVRCLRLYKHTSLISSSSNLDSYKDGGKLGQKGTQFDFRGFHSRL